MDKNFPNNMDKPNRRKYFVGRKQLKHVQLFEGFVNEAVKGTMVVKDEKEKTKVLTATNKFVAQVRELERLLKEYKQMESMMELMKTKSKQIDVLKEQLLPGLLKANAQSIRIEDLLLQVDEIVKTKAQKITYSYKEISEALEALIPVTNESKAQIEAIREMNKKINPAEVIKSYDIHVQKVEESGVFDWIKAVFGKLAGAFKQAWSKVMGTTEKLADNLDELSDKLRPLNIQLMTQQAAEKKAASSKGKVFESADTVYEEMYELIADILHAYDNADAATQSKIEKFFGKFGVRDGLDIHAVVDACIKSKMTVSDANEFASEMDI